MNAIDFEWPKALRALKAAAEDGSLEPRNLYPVEVKALCDLTAGAPLDESPRAVAPGMSAVRREEYRDHASYSSWQQKRAAYFFVCRFRNSRVWQCSLFTEWHDTAVPLRNLKPLFDLSPRYIVRALTRSLAAPEGRP